jgi:L-threonylcarbamoyladenylate synthase
MRVSPTTAGHVVRQLGASVDVVLDGGATDVGIESTVLDLSGPRPVILRPGSVTRAAIESVVGAIEVAQGARAHGATPRPSPGMDERHYAPAARLIPFGAADASAAARQLQSMRDAGGRVGVIAHSVRALRGDCTIILPADAAGYARGLYAALHALDEARCSVALVERVPDEGESAGVADRLRRAGVAAGEHETPGGEGASRE